MSSKFSIQTPTIDFQLIPENERLASRNLLSSIRSLSLYIEDFEAAVDLFQMARPMASQNCINSLFSRWMHLAARDGAMTIFHFERVLIHSGKGFKECLTLIKKVDHSKLSDARVLFSELFPKAARLRHSVGHSAEMRETVKNSTLNTFSGSFKAQGITVENSSINIQSGLFDNIFTTTHEGEVLSYEISHKTTASLALIAAKFYEGFSGLERKSPFGN